MRKTNRSPHAQPLCLPILSPHAQPLCLPILIAITLAGGCGRSGFDVAPAPADEDGANLGDGSSAPNCTDVDSDGYLEMGCPTSLPADCNDADPAVHPGAMEICGNAEDEDCSGVDLPCADALAALEFSRGGGITTVGNTAFMVGFDDTLGGVPTDLRALDGSGENVIFSGMEKNERLAGISHFDHWFSWRPDSPVAAVVTLAGPAAVQVELSWQAGEAPAGGMDGVSRYTIYPDGRIHRDERVHVYQVSYAWFLAYMALDISRWDQLIWDMGSSSGVYDKVADGTSVVVILQQAGDTGSYLCARDSASGDIVGWTHHERGTVFPDGFRSFETAQNATYTHSLLLASEWVLGAEPPVGDYYGHVMMSINGSGNCAGVAAQAAAFATPPSLTLSAGILALSTAGDDDGDGYNEGLGCYVISGENGKTITATIAGSEALPTSVFRLQSLVLTHDPTVWIDDQLMVRGQDYLLQIDADQDGGWLFVARPLVDGSTIAIIVP